VDGATYLPEPLRERLRHLARGRINQDGVLVIEARRHRTQERNRQDALERLIALIREAAIKPKPRIATKPTYASKQRRLEAKQQRSLSKRRRHLDPFGEI
jgi:ribosome-associated protein